MTATASVLPSFIWTDGIPVAGRSFYDLHTSDVGYVDITAVTEKLIDGLLLIMALVSVLLHVCPACLSVTSTVAWLHRVWP
jgi:hypothetical protein